MTRIRITPLADSSGRVNQYASVVAWLNTHRPVDGYYFTFEPGGVPDIVLPAPEANTAWNVELRTIDAVTRRFVSFSGDTVDWSALIEVDPATITPVPVDAALAEWQAVLTELENYARTPGPSGPRGEKGEKGDTGSQGDPGPQGDPGAQGNPGIQGVKGDPGIAGPTGPTGTQGIQGPTGPKGDPGVQGVAGPTGPAGPTGATGPAGQDAVLPSNIVTATVDGTGAVTLYMNGTVL